LKNFRQLIIGLLVAGGALYYTLRGVPPKDLWASFSSVRTAYLAPAVVLIVLSYWVHACRWRLLLIPLKNVPVSGLYAPMMVGNMGNLLPARAGELLRAYFFGKKYDVPFSGALATILVLRLFDLVFLLLLVAFTFIVYAEAFDSLVGTTGLTFGDLAVQFGRVTAALLAVILVFTYFLLRHAAATRAWVGRMTQPLPARWRDKITFLIEEFLKGFEALKTFALFGRVAGLSVLELAVNVVSFYPLYWAYNLDNKSLESLLVLTVVLSLILIVLPAPAFLGSFQAGVMIALHQLFGEDKVMAAGFGMMAWVLNFLVVVVAGLYFIFHDHLSLRQVVKIEPPGP
jgi:uncharacterized protein (TIRG00374 family)